MKTLLFICCAAFAVANAVQPMVSIRKVLRDRNCLKGSEYACTNITTAVECRSVKHCIQTVWENLILPEDDSSICETCKEMVKEARDQLLSNITQQQLKQVFDETCDYIPLKEAAKECRKVFDNFVPELVDILASQMNPQVVCATAGLCNNPRLQNLIATQGVSASLPCATCKKTIAKYEEKFRTKSEDEVLQMFLQTCGKLGSFSDACSNLVLDHFDEIYSYLKNDFHGSDLCYLTTECSALFHTHRIVSSAPWIQSGESQECEFCEQLVERIREILTANTTESEFKQMLLGICDEYPSFKKQCTEYVDEFYSEIYNYLVHELVPKEDVLIRPLLPIETIQKMEVPESRVFINSPGATIKVAPNPQLLNVAPRILPKTSEDVNMKYCAFCEYFLHFMQQEITDPKNVQEIKNILDHACSILPNSVRVNCDDFVNEYGNDLVALLAQDIDPSTICPKLKVCPNNDRLIDVFIRESSGDQGNCPLCLFAITELEEMVKENRTEENIRESLEHLCSHLKSSLKEACNDFVQHYSTEIIEAIMAQLTPQEVCELIKMCKDTTPAPLPQLPHDVRVFGGVIETNEIPDQTSNGVERKDSESVTCILCDQMVNMMRHELESKKDQNEILRDAYSFCNTLPNPFGKDCDSFVYNFGKFIIYVLIEELEPIPICANLFNCPYAVPVVPIESGLSSPECFLCKLIMRRLTPLLENVTNEEQIINAVHEVCNILPREMSNDCNDFIDKYGDEIIQFLNEAMTPAEICSLLMICSSNPLSRYKYEVDKCGSCQATVSSFMQSRSIATPEHRLLFPNTEKVCSRVPLTSQPMCRKIMKDHAKTISANVDMGGDEKSVCEDIKMCQPARKVGANRCVWGPGYWCTNATTAQECGFGAVQHCQEHVWKSKRVQRVRRGTLVGSNKCTWGPGYWCQSIETANECSTLQHCQEKVWLGNAPPTRTKRSTGKVGTHPCTWGPSYWCQSLETAEECGPAPVQHCRDHVWKDGVPPKKE